MSETSAVDDRCTFADRFDYCSCGGSGFFARHTVDQRNRSRSKSRGWEPLYVVRSKQFQRKRRHDRSACTYRNEREHGGVLNALMGNNWVESVE